MLIVTGGIACGKSTFVDTARELLGTCAVIDADEWYHGVYMRSDAYNQLTRSLFNRVSVKAAAFTHLNWSIFENAVADAFCEYVNNAKPTICVIPEFFKRADYFDARLGPWNEVLTIERDNNVDAAIKRDGHRTSAKTRLIAKNQSTIETRVDLSDYVLYNVGSKDEFKEECVKWLKSHLPEVSTHPTKAIGT